MSGYYGPSGSYLYDSEEYVTLTKAAHDALAARVRELEAACEWKGVYAEFCIDPELCRGRGSCPRERSCCE